MVWFPDLLHFYNSPGSANTQESYSVSCVVGVLYFYIRSIRAGSIGTSVRRSTAAEVIISQVATWQRLVFLKTLILFAVKSHLNTDELW